MDVNYVSKDIFWLLKELRSTTSTKEKYNLLLSVKDNEFIKSIFEYTYNKVKYTYGVTSRTVLDFEVESASEWDLFLLLNKLSNRELTGHEALRQCKMAYSFYDDEVGELFLNIIDRDLKVGLNEKTINKVWKGLIPKVHYCRCDIFNKKNAQKIQYPAYIQLKCDGTYRECYVSNSKVQFKTRSGESYTNPILEERMQKFPSGYYTGEFTIGCADNPDSNRSVSNGNINSDNPDFKNIHFTIWDYLTEEEYNLTKLTKYEQRFNNLKDILEKYNDDLIHLVPTSIVNNVDEALKVVSGYMNKGLEGGILKSFGMVFKNGTSKEQLKIKLKVDVEMRCTGFIQGTPGTKYENQNKVIVFENDEGTIKGQCSGMTDDEVLEVTKYPNKYIGKILSIQFNDLSKAENNSFYALSHPRFSSWRDDKNETDTLEKAIQLRDLAKDLK